MRIEAYFRVIHEIIENRAYIRSYDVNYDKRGTHEGFIRGEIAFTDETQLHFREFVDVEFSIERIMYVYQYQESSTKLIFRYDNSGHHQHLNLSTFPHHKHLGLENEIIATAPPDLPAVLQEIEELLNLS